MTQLNFSAHIFHDPCNHHTQLPSFVCWKKNMRAFFRPEMNVWYVMIYKNWIERNEAISYYIIIIIYTTYIQCKSTEHISHFVCSLDKHKHDNLLNAWWSNTLRIDYNYNKINWNYFIWKIISFSFLLMLQNWL